VENINDVACTLDGLVIDAKQHIAALQPHPLSGASLGDLISDDAVWPRGPQNPVFDFVPRRARVDIGYAEAQQCRHDDHR
jgi:hypothetical protein